jgi:hypothetical protein
MLSSAESPANSLRYHINAPIIHKDMTKTNPFPNSRCKGVFFPQLLQIVKNHEHLDDVSLQSEGIITNQI